MLFSFDSVILQRICYLHDSLPAVVIGKMVLISRFQSADGSHDSRTVRFTFPSIPLSDISGVVLRLPYSIHLVCRDMSFGVVRISSQTYTNIHELQIVVVANTRSEEHTSELQSQR